MKRAYRASCHCGKVVAEAALDLEAPSFRCNCSICRRTRFWPAVAAPDDFRLLQGDGALVKYVFAGEKNHHFFCGTCGVRVFGVGNDTPAAAAGDFAKTAGKAAAESMTALAGAQAKFVDQLAKSQEQASALAAKAQAEASAQLAKAQAEAAAQIAKAQSESSAQVAKAQADMTAKLTAALDQASAKIGTAQTEVATQLGRVTALASSIDNVLKLQQAVDGTLKGVTVTDEFKSTLVELKRHLAESDQLLKNAAKPRTIRLVEKDTE